MSESTPGSDLLTLRPTFCQYADGPCDQDLPETKLSKAFWIFPSSPTEVSAVIDLAVREQAREVPGSWRSWRDLDIDGRLIFCEICKSMRATDVVIADITTLNMNVMFEIGFAVALGLSVIPIRDTSYSRDDDVYKELGLFDTLGYTTFQNADELQSKLVHKVSRARPLPPVKSEPNVKVPLYLLKPPHNLQGQISLESALRKSALRYRSHDPVETSRLTMTEARRSVQAAYGVVVHLISPERRGSKVHNARCAFVAGLAMGDQRAALMLQESDTPQPIDYRDVARHYVQPSDIPKITVPFIRNVVGLMQDRGDGPPKIADPNTLLDLDLGDFAAENEISDLQTYFVPTGQWRQAKAGHARLVVGRKGSGKTAIFYRVRDSLPQGHSTLSLDLKPEGDQFLRLREAVLDRLSAGMAEHTMVALWTHILLTELARKVLNEYRYARMDPERLKLYEEVERVYAPHNPGFDADFSQRLTLEIERVCDIAHLNPDELTGRITEHIYRGDIRELRAAVGAYLEDKDAVWVLVDNLDKSWPTHGASSQDILVVRSLMEATRKLQRELGSSEDVELKCLVFLRTDIYEMLVRETPDKGKDTAIKLDWDDHELFEQILARRIDASTDLGGNFREAWPLIAVSHIGVQDSFTYMLERTLMRPRDILRFVSRCVEVAINRGNSSIEVEDILKAERSYSEDLLLDAAFELQDTWPEFEQILYSFHGSPTTLTSEQLEDTLLQAGVTQDRIADAVETLLWFGFLGATGGGFSEEMYAHKVNYNVRRLLHAIHQGKGSFVVHPAFRPALEIK